MHRHTRIFRKPDGLLHVVTDDLGPLVYRSAAVLAVCFGAVSFIIHLSLLLGLALAPWTWDLLFPPAFALLVVAGLIAAWRGREQPILKRYDVAVQGWRPWSERLAKAAAFYSVACFLVFIVARVLTPGELSTRFSQAIAASHSGAFFLIAAMIFSASPPSSRQ